MRTANPGPWLEGAAGLDAAGLGATGLGAVISDGRLEAVLDLSERRDEAVRDRLAPFMAMDRL